MHVGLVIYLCYLPSIKCTSYYYNTSIIVISKFIPTNYIVFFRSRSRSYKVCILNIDTVHIKVHLMCHRHRWECNLSTLPWNHIYKLETSWIRCLVTILNPSCFSCGVHFKISDQMTWSFLYPVGAFSPLGKILKTSDTLVISVVSASTHTVILFIQSFSILINIFRYFNHIFMSSHLDSGIDLSYNMIHFPQCVWYPTTKYWFICNVPCCSR